MPDSSRPPRRRRAPSPAEALQRARSLLRLRVLLVIYLAVSLLVGARLVNVQVLAADHYAGLAEQQAQREVELPARRGRLYARDGEPLALSLSASTVYANPRVYEESALDPSFAAADLAEVLDQPLAGVAEQLTEDRGFVFLARQIPREVGEQVAALAHPGIGVLEEPTRVYPADGLAAQTVGFAGIDNTGLLGLEAQYDALLAGEPGRLRLERAPGGVEIAAAPREAEPPVPGTDLVLTLDREIQDAAERALAAAVEEHDAKGASAVVLEVETGDVLALASVPGFDSETVGSADEYARRNRPVSDVYEPGSVAKVVTVASALQAGVLGAEERLHVPEHITFGDRTFRDSHRQQPESLTVREILARSSNVGAMRIAERLGAERLHAGFAAFGFGEPIGLGLPGEASGQLPAPQQWSGTSLPTIAIGHGVSASLLQLATALSTVASGGEWIQPRLVRGTVGPDGRLEAAAAGSRRRVLAPEHAAAMARLLRGPVEDEGGTAHAAALPGYAVAGKTGTARKSAPDRRGYLEDAYMATFAGFAPAGAPELAVAVRVDEPQPGYASVTAAPVFAEILEFALEHRRVPPVEVTAHRS